MSKLAIEAARTSHPELPFRERLFLLEHVTGRSVPELIAGKISIEAKKEEEFLYLLKQRKQGAPIAALTGWVNFCNMKLKVAPWVFIPRPETEQLVTRTLEELLAPPRVIVELGTGTGAIAIALARAFPHARIVATELSPMALNLAKINATKQKMDRRIEFVRGNLFKFPEACMLAGKIDLLISNPPYIPTELLTTLPVEVRNFDPPLALNGGPDGFRVTARILDQVSKYLSAKGLTAIEIDPLVSEPLKDYTRSSPLIFSTGVDSFGNLRFLFVRKK